MVVVDSDNQMFYNTSKERVMGEDEYMAENDEYKRRCSSVPSPGKHQDDTHEVRPEGFYHHEMEDEPNQNGETRDREGDEEDRGRRREEFECPFCPSKFGWRSALMQHQESQHGEEQMFICDHCDKIFTDAGNLQRHIRTQHAGARSHSCPECGKTFATSSGLKQHTHIHSSIKPFICEVCLKSYTQFSNLCRHKRMHADCRTQLKCSTCGQMYTTITSLNKHRRFCHSASPLISRHLSPISSTLHPPSVLPYNPPLIGLPPSAFYQASLAQMWNANIQQALLAQSLGKAAMMPNPYLLGYPPLSTPAPLYPSLHPGGAGAISDALGEGLKRTEGRYPSFSTWTSPLSATIENQPSPKRDDEEAQEEKQHKREAGDLEPRIKRMRVESVSPAVSPVNSPPSSVNNEPAKIPSFVHRAAVPPTTGSNPPRIASPANSLGHQEDGRSAFSPPRVSPVSSTRSTEERSPRKPSEQPLDLTMQKTPSPPVGRFLSDPMSPLSGSFSSDRLSHLLERRKSSGLFSFPSTGYPTQLPSSFDPMYKVKLEQHHQQMAEHYSRSAALSGGLPGLTTFPPSNLLGSPQAAFLKYHNLHHGGRQFPFGTAGVVYPTSSKDMMIRGGKDRYTCKFCGKLFPRSANLTRHLRTHTGEQPYSCKYCDRSFSISSNLQRHVRNIHNKEKPFRCPLCDRCFGQQTNLDRHLKKHDNEQNGEITTTSSAARDSVVDQKTDDDVKEDVVGGEDSGDVKSSSPRSAERTPSPPVSPLKSEPAQPLKIQYKIARGRSPLSSSGTCQSPPSAKIDSGMASRTRDDSTEETRGTDVEGPQDHIERPGVEVQSFSYMINGPSSWDRQGLGIHKPKAILT